MMWSILLVMIYLPITQRCYYHGEKKEGEGSGNDEEGGEERSREFSEVLPRCLLLF